MHNKTIKSLTELFISTTYSLNINEIALRKFVNSCIHITDSQKLFLDALLDTSALKEETLKYFIIERWNYTR